MTGVETGPVPTGMVMTDRRRQRSQGRDFVRRILKSTPGRIGALIILCMALIAFAAPLLAPYDPYEIDVPNRLQGPSAQHFFGTDQTGRDVFSRILYGSQLSLRVGLVAVAIALIIGVPMGLVAAYYGGIVDQIIMRIIDIMLAFPGFLLALAVIAMLGPSLTNSMLAVGIGSSTGFARIVRGSVLSLKENDYVMAARVVGATDRRIMRVHILPNALSPIIVLATLEIPVAILIAAGLSFLGLGAQPPSPEWGAMLVDGRLFMQTAPWMITFPGLAIFMTVLGFNLFGNAIRDALDPRLQQR